MYKFLRNMWILEKVDEKYLDGQVERGRITKEEKNKIIEIPQ